MKPGEAQYTSNQHRLASLQVNAHDRVLATHRSTCPSFNYPDRAIPGAHHSLGYFS